MKRTSISSDCYDIFARLLPEETMH